jgi:hypothetical protein
MQGQHECKANRTTLFNFKRKPIIVVFFYTKFPVKKINVGKILKL